MRREVGISIVVIALLVVGGLVMYTSLSRNLSDTQATVTSQADELDTQATSGAAVANAATESADEAADAATDAASTQSALEGNVSDLESAETQSADEQSAAATDAAATQSALEDEAADSATAAASTQSALEGNVSDLEATGTQSADEQSAAATDAAATQSALEDDVNSAEASATQAAEAAQDDLATSQSQITILEGDATQAAVQRAEVVMAAATAQAASAATLTALQAQMNNPPTSVVTNPTLVPLATPGGSTESAIPLANVDVGNLNFHEEFGFDSAWFVGPVTGAGNAALANGQYVITVDVVPQSLQSFAQPIISNGYGEVEAYLTDCTRGGFVGVLMRVQDFGTGGYLFAYACDLSFWAIVVFPTNGQPQVLNTNTLSGVAPSGPNSPHTIGVMVDGNFLAMYLNGQLLGSTTDNTFSQGMVGLYGESGNAQIVLRFDNFRVWNLP